MSEFLRKYGTATHVYVPMVKRAVVDFAVGADWTPAAGDVKVSKDGGAAANITTLPVAITMGNTATWDFALSATEMQAAKVVITVADSATKAVEDQQIDLVTFGNAAAEYPPDFSDTVRLGLTALPNAAPGVQNGLGVLDANLLLQSNLARWKGTAPANLTGDKVPAAVLRWLTDDAAGTPNALAAGRADASVGAMANNVLTAAAVNAAALNGKGDWLTAGGYTAPDNAGIGTLLVRLPSALTVTAGKVDVNDKTGFSLAALPAVPANWLTAAGIAAGALNGKGDWLTAGGYTAPDNATITWVRNVLEGDEEIDTGAVPWHRKVKTKQTATVLVDKVLRKTDGSSVAATTDPIGSARDL